MSKPNRHLEQSRLADPHKSYKSVHFGMKQLTAKTPVARQSTLSQFLTATPQTSTNTKGRSASPQETGGKKRKSLDLDNLRGSSPEKHAEQEGDVIRVHVEKRQRMKQTVISEDQLTSIRDIEDGDAEMEGFIVKDSFDSEEDESYRPPELKKRRKRVAKSKRLSSSNNRTLTQMSTVRHILDETDHGETDIKNEEGQEFTTEEQDQEGEETASEDGDGESKDQQALEAEFEAELQIKDEPRTQAGIPNDLEDIQQIKYEGVKTEEFEKENIPDEDLDAPSTAEQTSTGALTAGPQTPHRPIPSIIPSSYTPPVTPLSPLRHQQLTEILASPSVQRSWRMSGRKMPGLTVPGLSPVAEHQKQVEGDTTIESDPVEPEVPAEPLKRPDFMKETVGVDISTEDQPNSSPVSSKRKVIPSTQWWEQESGFSSIHGVGLEPIQEVDSQSQVQVRSSVLRELPAVEREGSVTPKVQRVVPREEVEVVPESPVSKHQGNDTSDKTSFPAPPLFEPLLRSSSNLYNTVFTTSFFKRGSSMLEPASKYVEDESQTSEVSLKSVDRQLMNESASAERIDETQLKTDETDPDATVSQTPPPEDETPPKDADRTPLALQMAPIRDFSALYGESSNIPLLPPSSPPQQYNSYNHINLSPISSKGVLESPSNKISSSPIAFKNNYRSLETQDEDPDETADFNAPPVRKSAIETLSQWKLRMFGPSQAVPTISQILGGNSSGNGITEEEDDDDDEDEEL